MSTEMNARYTHDVVRYRCAWGPEHDMDVVREVVCEAAVTSSVPITDVVLTVTAGGKLLIDGFPRYTLLPALGVVHEHWRDRARALGQQLIAIADPHECAIALQEFRNAVLHTLHAAWLLDAIRSVLRGRHSLRSRIDPTANHVALQAHRPFTTSVVAADGADTDQEELTMPTTTVVALAERIGLLEGRGA